VVEQDAGAVADTKPPEPAPETKKGKILATVELVGVLKAIEVEEDRAILLRKPNDKEVFHEGDSVLIVGESDDGGKHAPLYARATVTVSTRTLVKAAPTEGELVEGLKLFLMKDKAPRASGAVAKRDPARLTGDDADVVPPRKDPEPVVKNDAPPVVKNEPPPVVKNEPPPVVKNEPPPVVKNEPPAVKHEEPAKGGALTGAIGVSPAGAGGQVIRIQNQSGRVLTGCSVRLTSNRTATIATLAPGEIRMRYADFRPDPRPPDPQANKGWSAVVCREGSGYFWTTWLTR
jgi:hypothetical protein